MHLRSEKDIRLRIDLLEGQADAIAKMLAKAMREYNDEAIKQYSERLMQGKVRVEELLWVLGLRTGQGILGSTVVVTGVEMTVGDVLERLGRGELKMDQLSLDAQALVRRGALEAKNAMKYTI